MPELDQHQLSAAREAFRTIFDLTLSPEPVKRRPARRPSADLDEVTARQLERQARHSRELAELLLAREELRGVYAPADAVFDGLRWSA